MTDNGSPDDVLETENSSVETLEEDNPSVDRGWAWVVCFGALVINIIYDGCSYSFGIFFTKFLAYFGDTRSHTAWIGSLFFSVPLLCGPIAANITSRIGYRKSTIIGGLIASIGFSCGAFSNSITILCVTYGLISGFGMSLPYFNSIVVEAVYFKKKRALATGIAESGAGVGTVIFAPLTNYLISVYGWRGALLIVGGIVANIVVCGALFRPLKHAAREICKTELNESGYSSVGNTGKENDDTLYDLVPETKNNACFEVTTDKLIVNDNQYEQINIALNELETSHTTGSQDVRDGLSLEGEYLIKSDGNEETVVKGKSTNHSLDLALPNARLSRSLLELQEVTKTKARTPDPLTTNNGVVIRVVSKYIASTHILTNRGFILFSLSNFVMYFWYDVPYVFLVDKAISLEISDTNATFLISIIGIVHTAGNIFYGDKERISKTFLYGVSIILCGISVTLMPLFTEYFPLAALAGLFGLFSAANEAMCSIILIQVVGLTNLNQSYGIVMMLQGIANLLGPPAAGMYKTIMNEKQNSMFRVKLINNLGREKENSLFCYYRILCLYHFL